MKPLALTLLLFCGCSFEKPIKIAHFIESKYQGHNVRKLIYADESEGCQFENIPKPKISDDGHTICWGGDGEGLFIPGCSNLDFSTGKITPIPEGCD